MAIDVNAELEVASGLNGGQPPKTETRPEVVEQETESVLDEVADEHLAEAQDETEQAEAAEDAQEVALGRMRLNDFLDAVGLTMEEFYRDIVVDRDGKEVSVSKAWDDYKTVAEANSALLRERSELQERLNQASTQMPTQQVDPEAQNLANQAQMKLQAIEATDWSQWEPGAAANAKLDLQMQAQQLWTQAQQKQAHHEQETQVRMRKALEEADRQTRSLMPEWNDLNVARSEWRGVADMANHYGIGQQEIDAIVDPRWRHLLRDMTRANAQTKRIAAGAKKLNKIGKTMGAGSRGSIERKKPTLRDAKQALADAKKAGASRQEIERMRLNVELPPLKAR